jgi:hypothetical protein
METLSHNRRYPDKASNPASLEYESRTLPLSQPARHIGYVRAVHALFFENFFILNSAWKGLISSPFNAHEWKLYSNIHYTYLSNSISPSIRMPLTLLNIYSRSKSIIVQGDQKKKQIRRCADNYLAFPISYFPICSTTKRIFLGWVKEVRTTKS